jgi:hypothetical protein
MANPARVQRMVVGLADPSLAERMLGVLGQHGAQRVLIVHGDDGLDELTTTGPSTVWELDGTAVRTWRIEPGEVGLAAAQPEQLVGGDPATNAAIARAVLSGERGPHRDVVLLNAAAGLLVGGVVEDLAEGLDVGAQVLDDGRAAATLERLVAASRVASAPGEGAPAATATRGTGAPVAGGSATAAPTATATATPTATAASRSPTTATTGPSATEGAPVDGSPAAAASSGPGNTPRT